MPEEFVYVVVAGVWFSGVVLRWDNVAATVETAIGPVLRIHSEVYLQNPREFGEWPV